MDDHRTFADLLALSLDSEDDFTCVGQATTVAEALELADELMPDVVVMDIALPDGNGLAATREIVSRHPTVRVLVLTAFGDAALFRHAADAGASAFLVKNGGLPEVLSALRGLHQGILIVNRQMFASMPTADPKVARGSAALTAREMEVLRQLADGRDLPTIAAGLSISLSACRGQVKSLRDKLGAHTQLEAVVKAARLGLLPSLFTVPDGDPQVPAARRRPAGGRPPAVLPVGAAAGE